MNDAQLIEAFRKNRAEAPFRSLVERHLPLVLSTARRITQDNSLAEEVSQTVFILLARKASSLRPGTIVSGWLYRTTCFVARRAVRGEQRRQRREQESVAMQMQTPSNQPGSHLPPHFDEALQRLSAKERHAVLLRFYEERSFQEVGASLGISEEAAKKRVTRGLDRLRQFFSRRGTQISAAALTAALAHETTKAAVNAAFISKVTAVGLTPAASSALLLDVLAAWRWTKIKLAAGAVSGAVATALLISQAIPATRHRNPAPEPSQSNRTITTGTNASLAGAKNAADRENETIEVAGQTLPAHPVKITVLDAVSGDPIAGAELKHTLMWTPNRSETPAPLLTDAKGAAVIRVPEHMTGDERMYQFEVYIRAEDYAEKDIMWLCSTGSVFSLVTNDYTARLERGITIGGAVLDEAGQPLAGVRVGAYGNNYRGFSYSTDPSGKVTSPPTLRVEDFSSFSQSSEGERPVTTDRSGNFQFKHFPSDLKALVVDLIGPDGSRRKFKTVEGERLTVDQGEQISFHSLQTSSARLVLPPGVTVEGAIVDAHDEPVAGATVSEGTQWGNLRILSHIDTDYAGRFWLSNRPPHEIILAASAGGYASASTIVAVKPGMSFVRIHLPPERPLKARVLNQDGEPVSGADVRLSDIDNEGLGLIWTAKTDNQGRFAWRDAPTNEVALYIAAQGYPGRLVRLQSATNELLLNLSANENHGAAYVTGTVFNATSGEPVEHFTVKVRHDRWSDWEQGNIFNGMEGGFSLTTSQSEVAVGNAASWFLSIEAPGYEPYTTRKFEYEEGGQTLNIKLQPGGTIEGSVRNPDGSTASDCQIGVATPSDKPVSSQPGTFSLFRNTHFPVLADAGGHFKLEKPANLQALVAFGKRGWAIVEAGTNSPTMDLQLLPWGHVEGTLINADAPVTNETIVLEDPVSMDARPLQIMQQTRTDSGGHFVFNQIPAGNYEVSVEPSSWQHAGEQTVQSMQTIIAVTAGATNHLLLKESGRTVAIKLVAPHPGTTVNWKNCRAVLNRDVPVPAQPSRADFIGEDSYMKARVDYAHDPTVLAAKQKMRSYPGIVSDDGTVTFENVPASNYLLEVKLYAEKAEDTSSPTPIDQLSIPVTVPENEGEGAGVVTLGTFTLEDL